MAKGRWITVASFWKTTHDTVVESGKFDSPVEITLKPGQPLALRVVKEPKEKGPNLELVIVPDDEVNASSNGKGATDGLPF